MTRWFDFDSGKGRVGNADLRPLVVIERSDTAIFLNVREIWQYRDLLYYLVWRDIKVRYKQTALGVAWAILQPMMMMIVFNFFFSRMAGGTSSAVPYSLFVFTGILPWTFFSGAIGSGGQSIVGGQNLVKKVFFPRFILPLSSIGTALVDLMVASLMLLPMMAYHRVLPGWNVWLLPVSLLGLTLAALGTGALLTSLTVTYRDFRFIIPFMIQLWMFATPAIFLHPDSLPLSPRWSPLLALNPAHGLIVALRSALLNMPVDYVSLGTSLAVSLALLIIGCVVFHQKEQYFADIV
jgi:lipopolysaccharide transport system permease protein